MAGRLRERLGEDFFRRLPVSPGVYFMLGDNDELLYVGKAKNLRTRIRSYTRLTRDHDPRLISLIAKVRTIRWEACATEADALVRETELLRGMRPPFNRAQTTHTDYLGIAVTEMPARVRLRMGANGPLPDETTFGCYPFEANTPVGYVALVRALVVIQPGTPASRRRIPSRVTRSEGIEVTIDPGLRRPLRAFLGGRSPQLVPELERRITEECDDEIVARSALKEVGVLRDFYAAGPRTVRRLQLKYGQSEAIVTGDVLLSLLRATLGDQVGATVSDEQQAAAVDELIATLRREGLGFRAIADRLNRDAVPRLRGGGRWTAPEVAEIVGVQVAREIAEAARELR